MNLRESGMIPTLSTIRAGQAELSEWMHWDTVMGMDDGGPVICRVVLALQRLSLVQLEKGDLVWIPNGHLLPTELAEEVTGSSSLPESLKTDNRKLEPVWSQEQEIQYVIGAHYAGFVADPSDFTDDPGTPPDLR